jgi:hypothetical protein
MSMNQSPQAERTVEAAGAYVEGIEIPAYDAAAVASRRTGGAARRATRRRMPGWAVAAAVCALIVAFVAGAPSVRAQVERMLQAFAIVNGQSVPVAVNSVSLEQARHDMPFAVIAPAAIPPGMSEAIDELNPSSSRLASSLVFRFSNGNQAPTLTIAERSVRSIPPGQMRLWMTEGLHNGVLPPAPPLPSAASGEHAFVQFGHGGQVMRQIRLEPISWVVRGTRIDLVSPPGLLSNAQLMAIRRAMSF